MEIDDIRAFLAVADTGGLTAAAQRLGVSKSVVSRQIARLEKDLGAVLLTRTTRGAALTEAGANFRDHGMRIAAEDEAAEPSKDLSSKDAPAKLELSPSDDAMPAASSSSEGTSEPDAAPKRDDGGG